MKLDWLKYEPKDESLTVTNWDGKSCRYERTCQLQERHDWILEVNFVGDVVGFKEVALRVLPERIIVKRSRELIPITGLPKPGATDAYFEFVQQGAAV